jgi:hypothetical protein
VTAMVGYGSQGRAVLDHLITVSDPFFLLQFSPSAISIGSGPLFWAQSAAGLLPVVCTTPSSTLAQRALRLRLLIHSKRLILICHHISWYLTRPPSHGNGSSRPDIGRHEGPSDFSLELGRMQSHGI